MIIIERRRLNTPNAMWRAVPREPSFPNDRHMEATTRAAQLAQGVSELWEFTTVEKPD